MRERPLPPPSPGEDGRSLQEIPCVDDGEGEKRSGNGTVPTATGILSWGWDREGAKAPSRHKSRGGQE